MGGIDIAASAGTKLPLAVGPVKNSGDGFGNTATISGTKGFVAHGAAGSRATKASEVVALKPGSSPEETKTSVGIPGTPSSAFQVKPKSPSTTSSFSPANQNTGTGMMATSAQVQMGAMGLTTPGGNVINNIYSTSSQQSSPMGNTLSAGTPSGNAGLSWLALVRR